MIQPAICHHCVTLCKIEHFGNVLIGRITPPARPSVCPSVPYGLTRTQVTENQNWRWTFPRTGITVVSFVSLRRSKVRRTAARYVGTEPIQFSRLFLVSTLYKVDIRRTKKSLCFPLLSVPEIFIGSLKNIGAFKVALKQNGLHLVCYAAVFLLQFSWVLFIVSIYFYELLCNITLDKNEKWQKYPPSLLFCQTTTWSTGIFLGLNVHITDVIHVFTFFYSGHLFTF